MKKLFFVAAIAVVALSSCKKDYTCTYEGSDGEEVQEYNDLDKDQADAAESACNILGGTWE